MAAPIPFGSEFLVNVATSGGEDSPSVAALANGDFVVAWEDNAAGTNDGKFRVFHADGSPLTGERPLNTSLPGNQGLPVVAALTDGRFVVAWRDNAIGNFDIKGHIYNGDGSPAGAEFTVSQNNFRDDIDPAIAPLAGGGFVVSWTRDIAGNHNIVARAYNAAGSALGNEFAVASNAEDETQSAVTGLANGGYAIAWTDRTPIAGDASGSHIEASILSGNGAPAGPTHFLVNVSTTAGDQTEPAIAGLINGDFTVLWTSPFNGDLDVYGKQYSSAGIGGIDLSFAAETGSDQSQVALAAAKGHFFFSWTDSGASSPGDGSGTHIGAVDASSFNSPFLADRNFVNGNQFESSIAALADGRILVVWTDGGLSPGAPDPTPNAVYGQIFDPRTAPVSLVGIGALNDDWVGTRFNDAMDGFAGNDRINGGAGNDTIFGGLGNDTLTGGAGNDLFVFNAAFKPAANVDVITDFVVADDTIELENALFTKLSKIGVLKGKFFEIGKHAGDHNDYLVYNKKTGVLSYDKDGDGHKHGIEIAKLPDHLHLTSDDFLVI